MSKHRVIRHQNSVGYTYTVQERFLLVLWRTIKGNKGAGVYAALSFNNSRDALIYIDRKPVKPTKRKVVWKG
jgi:hypothetical protein